MPQASLVSSSQKSAVPENAGDGLQVGQGAASLVGFFGAAPVVQPVGGGGNVHTPAAGSVTGAFVNTTWDGSIGSSAYTVGDIVAALKNLGLLAK